MAKYLNLTSGEIVEIKPVSTSAGSGDAGKMIELDGGGKISTTMMPAGIGSDSAEMEASEVITAGAFINIFNDGGTAKIRHADRSNGREVHGFCISGIASGATGTVTFEGLNPALSGMTIGATQFLGVAGAVEETATTTSGQIIQRLGVARSATEMTTEVSRKITLV